MDMTRINEYIKAERLCEKFVELMSRVGPQTILLTGKPGTGKTQLARSVSMYTTRKEFCYFTLWLHLNKKFEDALSLYENIAFQVDVYDRDEKEGRKTDDLVKDLKEKITAQLIRKKRSLMEKIRLRDIRLRAKRNPRTTKKATELPGEETSTTSSAENMYLLLILDDEGNKTSEYRVMKELGLENFLRDASLLKVLITRSKEFENTTMSEEETHSHTIYESQYTQSEGEVEYDAIPEYSHVSYEMEKWKNKFYYDDIGLSQSLLDTLTQKNMLELLQSLIPDGTMEFLTSLKKAWKIDEPLISCMAQKCRSLPAAVVVLAKSLDCITRHNTFKSFSLKQEKLFKEFLSPDEPAYSVSGYNPILQLAYHLLETNDTTLQNVILDCFWHSFDIFKQCGSIHYSELITNWILEGYFDPVRSVKKAYNDGHAILVELIKRGFLKIQEGDMVVPEMAMSNLIDLRYHGILGRSRLRFAGVYGGDQNKGLGKITQIDDMIKTVQEKKRYNICTLLVSGNRLRREEPQNFFKQMAGLEALVLFEPTLECLTKYLRDLRKLRVLVIRNCDLLSDIEELSSLEGLNVLEVSGASSVETIPDDFFAKMSELQTLNLSGLQIKHSPSSISQLKLLHSLILRHCPVLEDLPDIRELKKLEVIDVHGAHNLKTCFGKRSDTRRNQAFSHLQQLQLLYLSESKIKRLPMFHSTSAAHKLHSLTRLSLQNCSNLIKLPNLKPLSGIQILDLSGTTSLVDIAAVCFEQKDELKILNLSGTKFTKLPSTISELPNLGQLLLRDNSNLEAIPNVERLTSLEVFDVSGCTELQKIEGSFKDMSYLREVNLSGTKIEVLPEFPSTISRISNLSQLLLRNISNLEAIPNIEGLTSLEVFDVSGCTKLHKIEGSFKDMSYLREINLSSTKIESLPELPEESGILCPKLVILADSSRWMHDTWDQVKEAITFGMSMSLSSSDTVDEIQETSRKEVLEHWGFGFHEKKGASKEQTYKGHIYRDVYINTIPFVDTKSCQEVLEIQGSNDVDQEKETLAKAEFVVFVDNTPARISSIYNDLESVKGCWLEMCGDMKILFSGVDEERLVNLETLSITNLRWLENICSNSSFKNLKQLSLDCCPGIITLFPASAPPTSLEVLKIKFCYKLEKVFKEEVELPNLHTLCLFELPVLSAIGAKLPNLEKYKNDKCPELKSSQEYLKRGKSSNEILRDLDREKVDHSEIYEEPTEAIKTTLSY